MKAPIFVRTPLMKVEREALEEGLRSSDAFVPRCPSLTALAKRLTEEAHREGACSLALVHAPLT